VLDDDDGDAKDLLDYIKQSLLASSYAVFDATGGNANVSLEYGFAEGRAIDLALYACTHAATKNAAGKEAIISDLAGKSRNHYKQKEELERLLSHLCVDHSYTKRFERFLRNEFRRASKGEKKSARALALKIIHALDKRPERRRDDLVQEILAAGYSGVEINKMLTSLHRAKLINCSVGKYSVVTIT